MILPEIAPNAVSDQRTEGRGEAPRVMSYNVKRFTSRRLCVSTLALALLIVLAVATCTLYVAGGLYGQGSPWARDVCSLSQELCNHPVWSAAATGAAGVLYFVLRAFRL